MMKELISKIDEKLDEYLQITYPEDIFKAMKYTLSLPGKRLRPVMCLETVRMLGGDMEKAYPTACAIEMLHVQSLIHDDLPCMDNDDFRRGKPSNHKVFGEANAVLAGLSEKIKTAENSLMCHFTGLKRPKINSAR